MEIKDAQNLAATSAIVLSFFLGRWRRSGSRLLIKSSSSEAKSAAMFIIKFPDNPRLFTSLIINLFQRI